MIAAIIARMEANKVALGLKLIGGAAAFQAAVEKNPTATPAAYVFTSDLDAEPSAMSGVIRQRVKAGISVVLVTRNLADNTGAAATVDKDALSALVMGKLVGWSPAAGCDPLERRRSHLLAFRDGHLWWQDGLATEYTERHTIQES